MLNIIFHPDIENEVKASYEWYQDQAVGLGDDFLTELETAYQAITELPDMWPKFQCGFRRFCSASSLFQSFTRLTRKQYLLLP